jgi:hypothetical protein
MIIRIEIYDVLSDGQIAQARRLVAEALDVAVECVTVERLPEPEDPVYAAEPDCEFLREWKEGDFRLLLWDTNRTDQYHKSILAYEFYHKGRLIFSGADVHCSPMHSIDGDESVAALLHFLCLRPGDTDRDYFKDYSVQQMAFAEGYGEELSYIVMEMEERAMVEREDPYYEGKEKE